MTTPIPPNRVVIAGDWHGNSKWACHVVGMAARLLQGEDRPLILHLGDFGIWPGEGGRGYLGAVRRACAEHGVEVRFVDGNHEDFTQLEGLRISGEAARGPATPADETVRWLPRGSRWRWHGRTWLALGGGVSLDRAIRREGLTWWPEEEVTEEEAARVIKAGPADVMITHDCPSGVRHSFPPPPPFWDARDLARNDAHRDRLQKVVQAVRPTWLVHGHLHRAYRRTSNLGYGPVEVTGLDCDVGDGPNYAVLDVQHMQWPTVETV